MKERLTDTKRCNEWITLKPDGCSCHQCERLEECDNNMKLYIMKHFVPRVALDRLEPKRLDEEKLYLKEKIGQLEDKLEVVTEETENFFNYMNDKFPDEVGEYCNKNKLSEALVNKEADVWEEKD